VLAADRYRVCAWLRDEALGLLRPAPRGIAVFGSFAGGALRPESDLDLLLVGDAIPRRPAARSSWFLRLSNRWRGERPWPEAPVTLSPLTLTERGWQESIGLRLSLSERCWILLDDGTLSAGLEEAREAIHRGDWTRHPLPDGGWAWIPRGAVA
jgi:hypothetical protein